MCCLPSLGLAGGRYSMLWDSDVHIDRLTDLKHTQTENAAWIEALKRIKQHQHLLNQTNMAVDRKHYRRVCRSNIGLTQTLTECLSHLGPLDMFINWNQQWEFIGLCCKHPKGQSHKGKLLFIHLFFSFISLTLTPAIPTSPIVPCFVRRTA